MFALARQVANAKCRSVHSSAANEASVSFGQTVPSSPGQSHRTPSLRSRKEYTPKSVPAGVDVFIAAPSPSTPAISTTPFPMRIIASFLSRLDRSICAARPRRTSQRAVPVAPATVFTSSPVALRQCSDSSFAANSSTPLALGGRTISALVLDTESALADGKAPSATRLATTPARLKCFFMLLFIAGPRFSQSS